MPLFAFANIYTAFFKRQQLICLLHNGEPIAWLYHAKHVSKATAWCEYDSSMSDFTTIKWNILMVCNDVDGLCCLSVKNEC